MSNVQKQINNVIQIIQDTPAAQIADLSFVKDRYIQSYNQCFKTNSGDLMYHRNVIHFKQIVSASTSLMACDKFSLYACFATAAANGYSLDPADNEVYIIARGGKACLDRQAGAYVSRLVRSGQIYGAEQAKLVYDGDLFQVESGRVVKHVENFKSDIIIAGYAKMILDQTGADRFFIYRKSDWESWRKKSSNPNTVIKKNKQGQEYLSESLWDNGQVGGIQPEPNFLRTKIIKHAAKEKCWAAGVMNLTVESYPEVEVDNDDSIKIAGPSQNELPEATGTFTPTMVIEPAKKLAAVDADDFMSEPSQPVKVTAGKVIDDEDF